MGRGESLGTRLGQLVARSYITGLRLKQWATPLSKLLPLTFSCMGIVSDRRLPENGEVFRPRRLIHICAPCGAVAHKYPPILPAAGDPIEPREHVGCTAGSVSLFQGVERGS